VADRLTMSVVLQLVDEMSAQVKASVERSKGALDAFGAHAESIGRSMEALGARIGAIGGAVQLGLSRLDLDMLSVTRASVEAEKALFGIATTAGKSGAEARASVDQWAAAVNQIAIATNKAQAEVITAFQDLVAKGISDADAVRMLEPIGRAATAAGADIRDMASAANAAFQNLGIAPERLAKALDIMAQAGKSGAFELRDMAQYFDALTVKSALLGSKGEAALAQLAAAAQIARKGAGDAASAANNLANFLDKLTGENSIKNFQGFGIDIVAEIKKGIASGDLIGYLGQLIRDTTKGDAAALSAMFTDMQAKAFVAPLVQNLEEYKRIRDEALGAQGVVAQDFDTVAQSMAATFDRLKIAGQAALASSDVVKGLLDGLARLAEWAAANPNAVAILGIGSAAAVAGGAIIAGVGAVIASIGTLSTALTGLSAFLLANPLVLAVLGLAVSGAFVYRHWDEMAGAARLGAEAVKRALNDAAQYLKGLQQQFVEIGRNLVQGLVDGMKARAAAVVDGAKMLADDVVNGVKGLLKIRSPSQVMMELGQQTAAGYVLGLNSGVMSVQQAAGQMAQAAQSGVLGGVGGTGSVERQKADQEAVEYERQVNMMAALQQHQASVEASELAHQQNLFSIRSFFEVQSYRNAVAYRSLNLQSAGTFFSQLGVLMQSKSRALFNIGKAAAIGETIIDTYAAAQKAYKAMAGIPVVGPALGAAAAAAAVVAGMARVAAIRSTSFGSASGSPVLSGGGFSGPTVGGDAGVVPFGPPEATTPQAAAPARAVNIFLRGSEVFSAAAIRDTLIPAINEALGDGVTLNVRAA
jgi:hypothetical protein